MNFKTALSLVQMVNAYEYLVANDLDWQNIENSVEFIMPNEVQHAQQHRQHPPMYVKQEQLSEINEPYVQFEEEDDNRMAPQQLGRSKHISKRHQDNKKYKKFQRKQ